MLIYTSGKQELDMYTAEKRKLTLRLDAELIEKAKIYAAQNNTSISQLVELFLHDLDTQQAKSHTPFVQKLSGILPPHAAEDEYHYYLMEKYAPETLD